MKKKNTFYDRPNSNRGGALLSVIIVMAIVGILGALVMSMAYTNFKMKVVDRKAKDNFYTAEKVLEEVCAGLQAEASKQYSKAYAYVMEHYNGSTSSVDKMKKDFNTMFVVNMVDALKLGNDSGYYKIATLRNYVKDTYTGRPFIGTTNMTVPEGAQATEIDKIRTTNIIDTLEDGICLRNVNVTYTEGDYYNTITTDIKIATPDVGFAMIATMPEIAEFSFISEGGIVISDSGSLSLNGKAYAGIGIDETKEESILVDEGTSFLGNGAQTSLLVSKGDTKLNGGAAFEVNSNTSFWTSSLTAGENGDNSANNSIKLLGRTYVEDDTTLDGTGNSLILGGQYYGYGNDGDRNADGNSAIIINGHSSMLDMSQLKSLVLAGTSFVGTAGENYDSIKDGNQPLPEGLNKDDILMGDSIAIKTNQLAYLVPVECEGIVTNPMTYDQYKTLISGTDWKTKILNSTLKGIRRTLSSYGDGAVDITPVFTNRNGGVVYLYLDFSDAAIASRYFMDYYAGNSTKVQSYLEDYVGNVQFNATMSRIVTRGNYLIPTDSGVGYAERTGNVAQTTQEQINYRDSFEALCTKLITNKTLLNQTEEVGNTVYENLVYEQAIEEFFDALDDATTTELSNQGITYDDINRVAIIKQGSDIYTIVVQNHEPTDDSYEVPAAYKKGVIIATGAVDMSNTTTWEGLLICGDELTVSDGTKTLKANTDIVGKAMMATCKIGSETYYALNFFKDGRDYFTENQDKYNDKSDIRNCMSFENYKSE